MRATTELLLSLLERFVGSEVRLISERVQSDGQVLVIWERKLAPDEHRLANEPDVLISPDGETLRWSYSGKLEEPFTLDQLAEADPANEKNRHPTTKALAQRLEGFLRAAGLTSPSGSTAFVVLLSQRRVWPNSAAALVASATGQNYWELVYHARRAWRYPRSGKGGLLPAPYSDAEMKAAESVFAEPWFEKALVSSGRMVYETLVLPVVSSERFDAQVTGK